MDDIQFWVYIAFGLIYFIAKQMRKKKRSEDEQEAPAPMEQSSPKKKPMSFEDLLREITQEREETRKEEILDEYADEQVEVIEEKVPEPKIVQDHSHRRFADEESRKVYEASIKQAEGADLKFERDEHFKSKLQRKDSEPEKAGVGAEIMAMLQDSYEAKKAVIMSEIFNRKY